MSEVGRLSRGARRRTEASPNVVGGPGIHTHFLDLHSSQFRTLQSTPTFSLLPLLSVMGQEEFRKLLTRPATISHSVSSASTATRAFGATQKRQAAASSFSKTLQSQLLPSADKGKQSQKSHHDASEKQDRSRRPFRNSSTGDVYVDRAALRRQGQTDEEYADLIALHEEWRTKWLAAASDDEKREIEEQMAFLGGDARHSVLVKGLDFALLAQQKAKAEGKEVIPSVGSSRGDEDDLLEAAYKDGITGIVASQGQSQSEPLVKRTREEVLEALQRRKLKRSGAPNSPPFAGKGAGEKERRDAEFEKARQMGKFRPIGSGASDSSGRSSGVKGDVIITKDGKRLRKKIKKKLEEVPTERVSRQDGRLRSYLVEEASSAPIEELRPTHSQNALSSEAVVPTAGIAVGSEETYLAGAQLKLSKPEQLQVNARSSVPFFLTESTSPKAISLTEDPLTSSVSSEGEAPKAEVREAAGGTQIQRTQVVEDQDDDDVFADAGRWTGLASDNDEDEDSDDVRETIQRPVHGPSSPPSRSGCAYEGTMNGERDWFGGAAKASAAELLHTPSASKPVHRSMEQVGSILSSVGLRIGNNSETTCGQSTSDAQTPIGERQRQSEGEKANKSSRLQGLSDSALPSGLSRALLE